MNYNRGREAVINRLPQVSAGGILDLQSRNQEAEAMSKRSEMNPENSFFAVFCIEALSDELRLSGDKVYKMLTEDSDILDSYILPCYDALHTQGKDYIVSELVELMKKQGVLQ